MLGSCICILKEVLFLNFLREGWAFYDHLYLLKKKKKKKNTSVGSSVPPSLFSLFLEFRWHFCYKTASLNKLEEYSGY